MERNSKTKKRVPPAHRHHPLCVEEYQFPGSGYIGGNSVGPLRVWTCSVQWPGVARVADTLWGGHIMARRGDSRATDACLPSHWRDVRDWSIEKRQNHRVRSSLTSETRQQLHYIFTHWTCCFLEELVFLTALAHLTVNRLNPELLFSPSSVNTKSFIQSIMCSLYEASGYCPEDQLMSVLRYLSLNCTAALV